MGMLKLLSRSVSCGSLASVAAAMVLAGISTGAQAGGDFVPLRLQLGALNRFVYEGFTDPVFQRFYAPGKGSCLLAWTAGDPRLAELTPGGGALKELPGFGPTSIGVYDGPKGTPCSRVSTYANESLTFALGADTRGIIGANAFDRLELDIEVKGNARLELTMYIAGSIGRTYELRTGSSVVSGVGLNPNADGTLPVSDAANRIVNCSARSDSGPDSGPSDNCRWIISDLGQTFTIRPLAGEFSLEGGGDWGGTLAYDNNTLIFLTHVEEGDLACGGATGQIPIGDGSAAAACRTFGPPTSTAFCPSIHYVFRDIVGATKGCEFIKGPGQQLAASMTITFPPEPRKELGDVPPTTVRFPDGYGGVVDYLPKLCTGTVGGTEPNLTIEEVLTDTPPAGFVDVVAGNGFKDWACILKQKVEYLGPSMQISQTILVWGDPAAIRF